MFEKNLHSLSGSNYQEFRLACQAKGLRATAQRYEIYLTLAQSREHPTAETVFKAVSPRFPGLALDTVYRTLSSLAQSGFAEKLATPGGPARFDADLRPHHHFICEACGAVYDFTWPEFDGQATPAACAGLGEVRHKAAIFRGLGQCCAAGVSADFSPESEKN